MRKCFSLNSRNTFLKVPMVQMMPFFVKVINGCSKINKLIDFCRSAKLDYPPFMRDDATFSGLNPGGGCIMLLPRTRGCYEEFGDYWQII